MGNRKNKVRRKKSTPKNRFITAREAFIREQQQSRINSEPLALQEEDTVYYDANDEYPAEELNNSIDIPQISSSLDNSLNESNLSQIDYNSSDIESTPSNAETDSSSSSLNLFEDTIFSRFSDSDDSDSTYEPAESEKESDISYVPYFEKKKYEDIHNGYNLIDIQLLLTSLTNLIFCTSCKSKKIKLQVAEKKSRSKNGIFTEYRWICSNCSYSKEFSNSKKNDNGFNEINFRAIGVGTSGIRKFCAMMNIPFSFSKFKTQADQLHTIIKDLANSSMQKAAAELKRHYDTRQVMVAIDGSWQKEYGHNSLNGIVTAASPITNKIIDTICITRYCHVCKGNQRTNGRCENYCFNGSAGEMEGYGAVQLFQRSESMMGLQYVDFLGDGNSRAYDKVVASYPYRDVEICKLECINHFEKRFFYHLQNKNGFIVGYHTSNALKILDDDTEKRKEKYKNKIRRRYFSRNQRFYQAGAAHIQ